MHPRFSRTADMHLQPWFLGLLAAYVVLELSFNHRLLELTGGASVQVNAAQVHHLEIWARVVSGLGLALLLMRWLAKRVPSRLVLFLTCALSGLVLMWHVQKTVVDAIVARADPDDLAMSVRSYGLTSQALKGRIQLRGEPVVDGPMSADLKLVFKSLWSSSVLGLSPDDLEVSPGATQLLDSMLLTGMSPEQMRDAYRRAVMTPVALGASLFFGLVNVCQLLAAASVVLLRRLGQASLVERVRYGVLPVWLSVCFCMSWWPGNPWVDSPGYIKVARPTLWQQKPFLAPFVDWSMRAEPAWSDPVAWVHRELLWGYRFDDAVSPVLAPQP